MRGSLPRVAILVSAALFLAAVAATITFAAAGTSTPPATPVTPAAQPKPELVVPDVRGQAYVFAKGILEESGFAWKVTGGALGYAANDVATQSPAPGTRVVDTGTPLVTLSLARNKRYAQGGTPENASSYRGTPVVLAGTAAAKTPAAPNPAAAPKTVPAPKQAQPKKKLSKPAQAVAKYPQKRPPAFVVAGAAPEPLDEMSLPARAHALAQWVEKHPRKSPANVDHWLYQHQWIVTGARMGWWRGAEALRELGRVDRRVQQLWGVGSQSEQLATAVLARVEARAR